MDHQDVRRVVALGQGARVAGQDAAIRRVAGRIRRVQAGLADPQRPLGVLLLAGPAGMGKTTLATALAETLFGAPDRLIRLDPSDDEDEPVASRLTESVRRQPGSVILLDSIDRAHPRVVRLLAQAFETGRLADASGRAVDVRQALFLLISSQAAPPDLLADAVDEIVPFAPLGPEEIAELARRRLAALHDRLLRERQIVVDATDEAVGLLTRLTCERAARPRELDRVIGRLAIEPLSDLIVTGQVAASGIVVVRVEDGEIRVVVDFSTL
jgi:ATP-dependent Clp protease ATP-binding subunit ClpC